MNPILQHNILWCLATLVYVKVIVTTCDYLMHQNIIPADISRKIIHIAACSWVLFWPHFDTSDGSSWKLNVAIPFVYSIQLLVKGAIVRDPNDPDVKTMCRTGNPSELLYGPLLFTFVMMFCGIQEYMRPTGTYIMGALIGDGIAPLIGKRYPFLPYPTLGTRDKKTVSGSIGMFVGSIVGILTYATLLGVPKDIDLESVVMISLVATLTEAVTGIWDNPAIAFSVYWFVKATDIQIRI